jgi:hypothetical protein
MFTGILSKVYWIFQYSRLWVQYYWIQFIKSIFLHACVFKHLFKKNFFRLVLNWNIDIPHCLLKSMKVWYFISWRSLDLMIAAAKFCYVKKQNY